MGVRAVLGGSALTVEPGSSATVDVTLRNDGTAPETVQLKVTGPGGPFSYLVPDRLTIAPGGESVARLGFRIPRISVPAAGPLRFAVVVANDGTSPLADGVVEVLPFSALSVTLDPSEATVKDASRHTVSVGNRGNAPVQVALSAAGVPDGMAVRIDPPVVTASPDASATATVEVTPPKRPFTGEEREFGFAIVAVADGGTPVQVGGRIRQQVAVGARTLVTSGIVAGIVVIALVLGLTLFSGGSSKTAANPLNTSGTSATDACPAKGHKDPGGVSGLTPAQIPELPNTYSFLFVEPDGCTPMRFNPCEPVHYVQNATLAPPGGADNVRQAFAMLSQATGITFVDDGSTTEVARRSAYVPSLYPGRWAPILVSWTHFGDQGSDPSIQAVGRGVGMPVDNVLVSGMLSLNVDAVTNAQTRTPVQVGFGPPLGSGSGAIGADGVQWGRIILHELSHVLGLGHTKDPGALMYPETTAQTFRPAELRPSDLEGLRYLGKSAGCLTDPPLPAA